MFDDIVLPAVIFPDAVTWVVLTFVKVSTFMVPNEPVEVALELMSPEAVICPNELTLKLVNEPDKPVTVPLALILLLAVMWVYE